MAKGGLFHSFWVRFGLKVLAGEVILFALLWLLRPHIGWMQRIRVSDLLFFVGALLMMAAGVAMLNDPYTALSSHERVAAFTIQDSPEQGRITNIEQSLKQKAFALHLTAIGFLTILLSLVLYFFVDRTRF